MTTISLMTAQTSNGTGAAKDVQFEDPDAELIVSGSIGGGTLTLESSADAGQTWAAVPSSSGTAFSTSTTGVFGDAVVPNGDKVRAILSEATSPSLTVIIRALRRSK